MTRGKARCYTLHWVSTHYTRAFLQLCLRSHAFQYDISAIRRSNVSSAQHVCFPVQQWHREGTRCADHVATFARGRILIAVLSYLHWKAGCHWLCAWWGLHLRPKEMRNCKRKSRMRNMQKWVQEVITDRGEAVAFEGGKWRRGHRYGPGPHSPPSVTCCVRERLLFSAEMMKLSPMVSLSVRAGDLSLSQ